LDLKKKGAVLQKTQVKYDWDAFEKEASDIDSETNDRIAIQRGSQLTHKMIDIAEEELRMLSKDFKVKKLKR